VFDLNLVSTYLDQLSDVAIKCLPSAVETLVEEIHVSERDNKRIFLCGNGGSGANALHIENDISIGIFKSSKLKVAVETLGANMSVSGAISNDFSYEEVFSKQLILKASPGDLLIVFSGSGNSPNILKVLSEAKKMKVRTCAVVGFDGGKARLIADKVIHFPINDMQISEDLQLILGHLLMRQFAWKEQG
jgi:D-sedoheptulose 7-phosphate isomerase